MWRSHCCGTYRGADADCIADSDSGPGTHIRADADRGATSNASSDARSDRNTRSDAGANGDAGLPADFYAGRDSDAGITNADAHAER